ncbi:MAG: hypothetical protein WCS65_16520 [Verrucomicrobiae bacterium]
MITNILDDLLTLLDSQEFRTKVAERIAADVDGTSFGINDSKHGRMEGVAGGTEISPDEIEFGALDCEDDGEWSISFRANGLTCLSSLSPDGDDVSHTVEGSASGSLSVKVDSGSAGNSLSGLPAAEITEINCWALDYDMD